MKERSKLFMSGVTLVVGLAVVVGLGFLAVWGYNNFFASKSGISAEDRQALFNELKTAGQVDQASKTDVLNSLESTQGTPPVSNRDRQEILFNLQQ